MTPEAAEVSVDPSVEVPVDVPVDVVVIGGGGAGLACALQLGRSRRSVVVVDSGEPRNAPAAHMHGYLGHDGLPPGDLRAIGIAEVRRYGVVVLPGTVATLTGTVGCFEVSLADGTVVVARRVVVATGLLDELPAVPGVKEQWGRGVIHCPYCHGWEVRDQRIAVLATGHMAGHQALLFRQLSAHVTVVLHDAELDDTERRRLLARGIRVVDGPVAEIAVERDQVVGLRLGDGSLVAGDAVTVQPRFVARAELLAGVGVWPVPAPMGLGEVVETDGRGETAARGVYAVGNVHDASHQVLQAAADGARVGAMVNMDLVTDDVGPAIDTAEFWDHLYAERGDQMWSGQPNAALVTEVETMAAGTALDLGCGEGADVVWLAGRGWSVTGLEISAVALERARRVAEEAGVGATWVLADVSRDPIDGEFDLVSVQYPAVPKDPDDVAITRILDAVAPGGTLLVVHHSSEGHTEGHSEGHGHQVGPFDPDAYLQPHDIARHLDALGGWTIEVHERRPRIRPEGSPGPDVPDVVLRARRRR